jgi:uncharacterized OB-fold protein
MSDQAARARPPHRLLPMVEVHLTDVNPDELKIGQHVEMVTRKLRDAARGEEGMIVYGYKLADGS